MYVEKCPRLDFLCEEADTGRIITLISNSQIRTEQGTDGGLCSDNGLPVVLKLLDNY